jgi:serine protein kinase
MDRKYSSVSDVSEENKKRTPDDLRETYDFDWYYNEVYEDPAILRNAHQRLADMFKFYGTEYNDDREIVEYSIATEDPLNNGENCYFGREIHNAIHRFVNKIDSGARHLGPQKRIKLLLGPVGSGKSDFDKKIREYFEDYTRRPHGRMYTFRWTNLHGIIPSQDPSDDEVRSPLNQDPIVLLPKEQRKDIFAELNEVYDERYTLKNKQSLDPESEFYMDKLLAEYDENLDKVLENHIEIIRLAANENQRECIETFEPKDKKNQDETELTGDVNYSKIAIYGESDPRAFDYSGAFCNANRGLFSGEEILKLQREFLYDFLHATQENTIKPKNNPRIDIDQVIVGRTNMPEYKDKKQDEKMEAFNDRTKRIDFPYVLEYEEEARIYDKMLEGADIGDITVEPHTLSMAALFAVLTRIEEPDSTTLSLLDKAKAYNGEDEAVDEIDLKKVRENGDENSEEGEGMEGISPRFISDEISNAITDETYPEAGEGSNKFITPLDLFNYFEENLELHGSIQEENLEEYYKYLEMVREEYKELAIEDVRHALAYDKDELQTQGEKYMDHVMAYINDEEVEDELTGTHGPPDEQFMRSVEEQLDIPEARKDDFRQEVGNWVSRRARKGETFEPQNNDRLRRALERKIWEDKKHNINFSALVGSNESDSNHESWVEALMEMGYSRGGAEEVLDFAGAEVAKSEMENNN